MIAWYRGRMEFGPRALGHRSILADPGHPDMRDRMNAMVKMREAFRPFAPAVSPRAGGRWFDAPAGTELPYMISQRGRAAANVRAQLPAITHVDGSARRADCFDERQSGSSTTLLRAVGEATGREMVLNTSFNVKGQAIVNTPDGGGRDVPGDGDTRRLFLENVLVRKR